MRGNGVAAVLGFFLRFLPNRSNKKTVILAFIFLHVQGGHLLRWGCLVFLHFLLLGSLIMLGSCIRKCRVVPLESGIELYQSTNH